MLLMTIVLNNRVLEFGHSTYAYYCWIKKRSLKYILNLN